MDWSRIHFYADANTECQTKERMKKFNEIYYDVNNALDLLLNDPCVFLISGNKGMGKTATLKKLECLADEEDTGIITLNFSLDKLNYTQFASFINNRFDDNWRFYDIWLFLYHVLLITGLRAITKGKKIKSPNKLPLLLADLKKCGLIEILGTHALHIEKLELKLANIGMSTSVEEINQWSSSVVKYYQDILARIKLKNQKIIIVLDGLDDFLKTHQPDDGFFWDMISAANSLNMYYLSNLRDGTIKYVIAVRDDVIDNINDSDSNKLFQDRLIRINWNKSLYRFFSKDILGMLFNRFNDAGLIDSKEDMEEFLKHYFFGNDKGIYLDIKERELYNLTLNRPRDVLMLFETCKTEYSHLNSLNNEQFNHVKKEYALTHFLQEMKNELAYLVGNTVIENISKTIEELMLNRPLGTSRGEFTKNQWRTAFLTQDNNLLDEEANKALEQLFVHGYVGAVIKTEDYYNNPFSGIKNNQRYEFISENRHLSYNQTDSFVFHYAIQAGFIE